MTENDYLQPTIFWKRQNLSMLWAHLEEEVNEAGERVIPVMRMLGNIPDEIKKAAAMELADVQVMCNTILKKLGYPPVKEAGQYNFCQPQRYRCETYALQLIYFFERKVYASMQYRDFINNGSAQGEEIYHALKYLIISAEALMLWLMPEDKDRTEIRRQVFEKNNARGYYG